MTDLSPAETLIARLESQGLRVKSTGTGKWMAQCPAHEDNHESLSLGVGHKGKAVLKCMASCETSAVVAALGLEMKDLFPSNGKAPARPSGSNFRPDSEIERAYDYTDEAGNLLSQALRFAAPKKFSQRQPDGRGGWVRNLNGVRRVLYRLPEVVTAVREGRTVYIPEGEKDADNLARLGLTATTNAMGAEAKWLPEYTKSLTGAAAVVILPDNDNPGRQHAQQVAESLHGRVGSLKVLELPGLPLKGDVSDWLKTGGTRDQLEQLAAAAPEWQPVKPETGTTPGEIPPPELKGEYAGYQIAALLGFDTGVAADTNKAHAERIRAHLGENLAYCKPLGGWRWWDGRCWPGDGSDAPTVTARAAALSPVVREEASRLFTMAGQLARDGRAEHADAMAKAAKAHLRHAAKVEQTGFIRDALTQAAGLLRADVSRFDPRPWVVPFANGVWDHGQWREHRREDGFLSVGPVEYDPNADRSEINALIKRMTGGDADLESTLQDIAGYILSGASTLRTIPWGYGQRGTGKSTLGELTLTVLGADAGCTIDPSQLADDASRERLGATLYGKRLVVVSEAGNHRISAEVLKTLSGSDSFPVRRLYSEAFTARPSHVLLMVSNDPPRMDAYDEALRERVLILPLTHPLTDPSPLTFADGARIEEVRRNPSSALVRGFLAWAVEGLERVFRTQDIHRAECIEKAGRQFWKETDPLSDFWETLDAQDLECGITRKDLRDQYDLWCHHQGVRRPLPVRDWTRACRARGLEEVKRQGVRFWILTDVNLFGAEGADRGTVPEKSPAREKEAIEKVSGNSAPSAPSAPVEPNTPPAAEDAEYNARIQAAYVAACKGQMPTGEGPGSAYVTLGGNAILNPNRLLLLLVENARSYRAAAETVTDPDRRKVHQDKADQASAEIEALAEWWEARRIRDLEKGGDPR